MPGPEGYTPEDIIEATGKVKDPAETVDDKKEKKVNTSTNKRAAGDDKFVVAIGEASEVAAKRRSYDMRQEIRLQEQHESSLSRFKKLKKLGSDLAHGRIKEVMAISHADEYANQQRNENFLLAGSELARTSLEQARLASRRELAALAEQVKEDGEAKTDPGLEAEVNSLIAQHATAEPPMSDDDSNTAKLQLLENVRIKFPKEYEKTRFFAENIHDVAISVRDAYETNKSIVTGDRVNNLILKLGGSVAGGFETDANKDLIVKGYNIMARHKDGKLGKFVNPY